MRTVAAIDERVVRDGGLPRLEAHGPGAAPLAMVTLRPLNFGRQTESPAREVNAAHGALRRAVWPRFRLIVGASQVHGPRLFRADAITLPEEASRGPATLRLAGYDGFLTRAPGVLLTVGVADCVPAFLWAPTLRAVALLHAGWRGVAADIVGRAIAALSELYGADPAGLWAWWGPAIGPCCYPVGEEVVEAIRATAAGSRVDAWVHRVEGAVRVDLRAAMNHQARAAGVPAGAIVASSRCTSCDHAFHSYRRAAGGGGRMLALAGIPLGPT